LERGRRRKRGKAPLKHPKNRRVKERQSLYRAGWVGRKTTKNGGWGRNKKEGASPLQTTPD